MCFDTLQGCGRRGHGFFFFANYVFHMGDDMAHVVAYAVLAMFVVIVTLEAMVRVVVEIKS